MACAHSFQECDKPDYLRCFTCGTYWSPFAPPAETVYKPDYWTHERGHSTLEEQVYNCDVHRENGVSKNQYVLDLIDVPDRLAALDIGCAPGALLKRLREEACFAYIHGVDMEPDWRDSICELSGMQKHAYLAGTFPSITRDEWSFATGGFDLITAIDVFEHSHEPEAFLAECARLLKPGGQLILMLPLVCGEQIPERMFNWQEHVYIHSLGNMRAMMADAGLKLEKIGQWCAGHDVLTARKPKEEA